MLVHLLFLLSVVDAGTRDDRQALFDYLVESTFERESFSAIKNERLELDIRREMEQLRGELLDADTDEALFHALIKISNARKDRHLSVDLVPGGLELDETETEAPIRLLPDFSNPDAPFLFVSDTGAIENVGLGDRVLAVHGDAAFADTYEPYIRYSTPSKFWWELAKMVPTRSHLVPRSVAGDELTLRLEGDNGPYDVTLPFQAPDSIAWRGSDTPRYPGFDLALSRTILDVYRNFEGKDVLLIVWRGFRETLVEDVDALVDYAEENDLLDHDIVFDATRSRGGSNGAYAVQRLSPHPFKTTFGNLKLSDVTKPFIEGQRDRFERRQKENRPKIPGIDDGTWLMEWLDTDVAKGLEAGQAYSNDVPFKLAHLPKHSDGIIHPAETHFRGRLVVLLGPHGGSHLDQFASIVADNDLGVLVGMPAGGYSNTWEWEEVLKFPGSDKPLVRYMWSIGHTIRPNGQVLEGNAADVDELIPLTRENFETYHEILLEWAYRYFDGRR